MLIQLKPETFAVDRRIAAGDTTFLAADVGHRYLKFAEFQVSPSSGLILKQWGMRSISWDDYPEAERAAVVQRAIQDELFPGRSLAGKEISVCLSKSEEFVRNQCWPLGRDQGQQELTRGFERDPDWAYQAIQVAGTNPSGEHRVLTPAIKQGFLRELNGMLAARELSCRLVDVSAASLYNAFRHAYPGLEGCALIVDIGARDINLVFVEDESVYVRQVCTGADGVTREFAGEANMKFAEAEKITSSRTAETLVERDQAAFLRALCFLTTRLQVCLKPTIQFYAGQGGTLARRLFLCGGGSLLPGVGDFLTSTLDMPVEYLNPLQEIEVNPKIAHAEVQRLSPFMAGVVGLGLRTVQPCPLQFNFRLPPPTVLERTRKRISGTWYLIANKAKTIIG